MTVLIILYFYIVKSLQRLKVDNRKLYRSVASPFQTLQINSKSSAISVSSERRKGTYFPFSKNCPQKFPECTTGVQLVRGYSSC